MIRAWSIDTDSLTLHSYPLIISLKPRLDAGAGSSTLRPLLASSPAMSHNSDFQNELNALSREFEKHQPSDALQFCANHFFRRLESQRAEHHLSQHSSGKSNMNESSFPGSNPFGASSTSETSRGITRLDEEDEHEHQMSESPSSTPAFNTSVFGSSNNSNSMSSANNSSAPPPAASSGLGNFQTSPFGASSFGASGSFTGQRMAPISGNTLPTNYNFNRRTSVSAESMNPTDNASDNWSPPFHHKTPEQLTRLRKAIGANFIFSHLDDEQTNQVIGALAVSYTHLTLPTKRIV